MYRQIELSALIRLDVDEAKRKIIDAHRRTGGNVGDAALFLGVSRRSMTRFIAELGLSDAIERFRQARSGAHAFPAGETPATKDRSA